MSSVIGGGIIGGALGGGLAVTVLAPLTAANNFLGSYFFGSGMILGERQMYQDDWIKIKKRLDAGESFLVILEEVMKPNTQAIMQMARETVIAVSAEWNDIVLKYLQSIPQSIWDAINKINVGEPTDNPFPLGDGVIGIVNGKVQCAAGWHQVNNKCIKNITTFTPPTTVTIPGGNPPAKTPSPGLQPEIRIPVIKYDINASAMKLYTQMQTTLAAHYKLRASYESQVRANPKNSATWVKLIAARNKLITNTVNQISAMEKSYKNINAAWKQNQ